MRNYNISIQELCRKLKPVFGNKMDLLYLKYTMADSREKKAEIEQALSVLYEKYLNTTLLNETVLLEPPVKEQIDAEYKLGIVSYADQDRCNFGLREKDWMRHVCISGMSGSGKTMFAFGILNNMIEKKTPFIVFDWKKSFRPLLMMDKEVMCFTIGNNSIANLFKTNINKPPKGIPAKQWVNILCDLITESFFASYGVHKILRETLDRAFQDFGVYNGSNNYPTWYQIRDRLEEKAADMKGRSREAEWLESSLRIAYALTFGHFGEAINCKDNYGTSVEELFDKKAIFELQSLNGMEKKFFCEFILSYVYFAKKSMNKESNALQSIILVDEAHNIFLKDRPNFIKESVTDMVYRELREFGVGLVCLDQHISKLSDVVAGNSATNIAFQQFLPQDVETIANIMQLREHRKYFNMLPVGTAIVKLAERYHSPFMIKVPFIEMKETQVNDDTIKERMTKLIKNSKRMKLFQESVKEDNLKKKLEKVDKIFKASGVATKGDFSDIYVDPKKKKKPFPEQVKESNNTVNHKQLILVNEMKEMLASGFEIKNMKTYFLKRNFKGPDIERALRNIKERKTTSEDVEKINANEVKQYLKNSENAKAFLKKIKKKSLPTTAIYKELKISARKGNQLKKELLMFNLVEEVEERSETGWKKFLKVTDTGIDLLARG